MADETNQDAGPLFTPAERAYLDNRGETPPPAEPAVTPPEASQPSQDELPEPSEAAEPQQTQVPHGALHEERARRKDLEDRLRQADEQRIRMEERFRAWQQQTAPRPQPPRRPPTPDEDIFGHANHLNQQVQQLNQKVRSYEQQEYAKQQWQRLGQWGSAVQGEFAKTNPDYQEAVNHLREHRYNELKAMGANEQYARQQTHNEEVGLLVFAARNNMNPAKMAYDMARQRGYQPKAQADASKQLDIIEAGQQASKSLANAGGRAGGGQEIGLTEIGKMSEREYAAFRSKHRAKLDRLLGKTH